MNRPWRRLPDDDATLEKRASTGHEPRSSLIPGKSDTGQGCFAAEGASHEGGAWLYGRFLFPKSRFRRLSFFLLVPLIATVRAVFRGVRRCVIPMAPGKTGFELRRQSEPGIQNNKRRLYVTLWKSLSLFALIAGSGSPAVAGSAQPGQVASKPAPSAPASASATQPQPSVEAFQDWQLVCSGEAAGRHCVIAQQQLDKPGGQQLLAIQLMTEKGGLKGALILPFGIALRQGATLQPDGQTASAPIAFETCLPAGCLLPLDLDPQAVTRWQGAPSIVVRVNSASGGTVQFALSMKGFREAYARLVSQQRVVSPSKG